MGMAATYPKHAILDGHHDRPVRVLAYEGKNRKGVAFWTVLRSNGTSEDEVFVRGERLQFIPDSEGE